MQAYRVLVVEDDKCVRDTLTRSLRTAGFEIDVAAAYEDVEQLETPPQVVALDLRLPDCSGLATLRAVRSRWPTAAVVVITGSTEADVSDEALIRAGADDVLRKPNIEMLPKAIRMAALRASCAPSRSIDAALQRLNDTVADLARMGVRKCPIA